MVNMTECDCGRSRKIKHCTECGSTAFYAMVSLDRTVSVDDTTVVIRTYRCRRCGNKYDDLTKCHAPLVAVSEAEKRTNVSVSDAVKNLSLEERKALVNRTLSNISKSGNVSPKNAVNAFEAELAEHSTQTHVVEEESESESKK
jgi:hypothetical protein